MRRRNPREETARRPAARIGALEQPSRRDDRLSDRSGSFVRWQITSSIYHSWTGEILGGGWDSPVRRTRQPGRRRRPPGRSVWPPCDSVVGGVLEVRALEVRASKVCTAKVGALKVCHSAEGTLKVRTRTQRGQANGGAYAHTGSYCRTRRTKPVRRALRRRSIRRARSSNAIWRFPFGHAGVGRYSNAKPGLVRSLAKRRCRRARASELRASRTAGGGVLAGRGARHGADRRRQRRQESAGLLLST